MTSRIEVEPGPDGVWRPRPTVTLDAVEYQQLRVAAESWWRLWEVGLEKVLVHLFDDYHFRRIRAASNDISGAARWGALGPSYATLEQLRSQPAWVRVCAQRGCRWQTTVYDPAVTTVACPQHRARDVSEMRQAS
jgi:hypothetical protein